jgi:hypothetical protein
MVGPAGSISIESSVCEAILEPGRAESQPGRFGYASARLGRYIVPIVAPGRHSQQAATAAACPASVPAS